MKYIILKFIKKYYLIITIGLILYIIANIGTVVIPLSYQYLIDKIILSKDFAKLSNYAMYILGIFFIYILADIISNKIFIKYTIQLKKTCKEKIMAKILNTEVSTISSSSKGEVITRLTQDIDIVVNFFAEYLVALLMGLGEYIIILFVIFRIHFILGLISLAATPIFYLLTKKMGKNIGEASIKIKKSNENFIDCVDECLDSRETIKIYDCFSYVNNRFVDALEPYLEHSKRLLNITLLSRKSIGGLSILFPLVILLVGSYFISIGQITLGSLISILSCLNYILAPSTLLSNSIIAYKQVKVSYNRLIPYYDAEKEKLPDNNILVIPSSINIGKEYYKSNGQAIISVKDLCFSYGHKDILYKVSFDIYKNEFISLVGDNGSGKTTLMKILAGLLEVKSGDVYVDGILLNKENVGLIRENISVVRQKEFLFSDTVYRNITLDKKHILDEKIEKIVGQNLLQQEAGKGGTGLSGGEIQKVAIARALHKDGNIFLIDEGSTNLDKNSREILFEVLKELKGKTTIIVVDHYQSYISISDRILYVQDSENVILDTHDALYNSNINYRNLNSNKK